MTPLWSAPANRPPDGSAAEAIRDAEASLAHQNLVAAQVDLQVITAVLTARSTHAGGVQDLDRLQREIESAVSARTDLGTPAGARAFQRFLIAKLRDIRAVVETAGLESASKAALAAALASLYATAGAASTEPGLDTEPAPGSGLGSRTLPPVEDTTAAAAEPVAPSAAAAAPPALPAWTGGAPAGALPATGGAPAVPALASEQLRSWLPKPADRPDARDGTDGGERPQAREAADSDESAEEPGEQARAEGATLIRLPTGETVTAPSPELAAVIAAAVAGTPISEAFAQQGITIPVPGSSSGASVDPAQLRAGDIGVLTDRHALALGNGKVLLDNKIHPVASLPAAALPVWRRPPQSRTAPPPVPLPAESP